MAAVRLNLVLTGACPRACYGKHIYLTVPLRKADATCTTIGDVVSAVYRRWPDELGSEHTAVDARGTGSHTSVKVLKLGRLLDLADDLLAHLTATELLEAAADVAAPDATSSDDKAHAKASVLMHLVVQSPASLRYTDTVSHDDNNNNNAASTSAPAVHSATAASASTSARGRDTHAASHAAAHSALRPPQHGGGGGSAAPERPEVKSNRCCCVM